MFPLLILLVSPDWHFIEYFFLLFVAWLSAMSFWVVQKYTLFISFLIIDMHHLLSLIARYYHLVTCTFTCSYHFHHYFCLALQLPFVLLFPVITSMIQQSFCLLHHFTVDIVKMVFIFLRNLKTDYLV